MKNINRDPCLEHTGTSNQNNMAPIGEKRRQLWQGKRDRKFGQGLKSRPNFLAGFTILEVMIALVIMGISIGIFFGLIGNSSRLREKIDAHAELLLIARTKTEEAFLGILEKKYTNVDEKRIAGGTSKDGTQWKVSETDTFKETLEKTRQNIMGKNEDTVKFLPKRTKLLTIQVEGINIDTFSFTDEPTVNEKTEEKKKAISE